MDVRLIFTSMAIVAVSWFLFVLILKWREPKTPQSDAATDHGQ
jgi:predicted permease